MNKGPNSNCAPSGFAGILFAARPLLFSVLNSWSRRLLVGCVALQICTLFLLAQSGNPETALAEAERLAWLKNWTRAEPLFASAERAFAARGDRRNELYALISKLRGQLPQLPNAEVSQTLADLLTDPLVKSDQRLRLRCLVVKGDTDLDMDAGLAERDWTEALALAKALNDKGWESRATGELGILAFLQGDSSAALIKVGMALTQAHASGDIGAELRYLTLFGNGMTEIGRPEQALTYFDRALTIAHQEKDLQEPMLTYSGKATALVALGRGSEAKQLLEHALEVAKQTSSVGYQADLLTQLGLLANRVSQPKEAALRFEEASRLAGAADAWRTVSLAQIELSKIYEAAGNLAGAEQAAKRSVAACRRVSDRFYLPRYLSRLADVQLKRGRIQQAKATYGEAEDLINGVLVNASSPWTKSSLIGAMDDVFVGHFRAEAQYGRNPALIFHIVEEARGRSIADLLRARPRNQSPLSAELTAAERRIAALQITLQKTSGRAARQRILDQLFETEQSAAPLSTAANRWMRISTRPVELEGLQRVLQPDEALLEYVLDEPASYCLIVSRSSARLQKLAGRSEVDRTVAVLLKDIRAGRANSESSRQLYVMLLAPVEQETGQLERLIIVPDGVLHQLPFEVLLDRTGSLVLRSHTLSYSPSGSVLTLLRSRKSEETNRRPLLAVSSSPADQSSSTPSSNARPFGSVVRGVFDVDRTALAPLPAANGEVRDIAEILGNRSIALTNATEADVKAQPLDQFAVLHFAVHGLTSTKFPERSTLILRSDEARHEDGLLQAREILDLRLNADLVTLSACDSGGGQIVGQEGVASLARPFLVAGARSVVANLWSANDDFSRTLMKAFYTHLAHGEDTGRSLKQAKLDMIELFGNHATPYLWGGFIVTGDSAASLSHNR